MPKTGKSAPISCSITLLLFLLDVTRPHHFLSAFLFWWNLVIFQIFDIVFLTWHIFISFLRFPLVVTLKWNKNQYVIDLDEISDVDALRGKISTLTNVSKWAFWHKNISHKLHTLLMECSSFRVVSFFLFFSQICFYSFPLLFFVFS